MFSLHTAYDLLIKCEHEIDLLSRKNQSLEYDYAMVDAIKNLSDLFEWHLKDNTISMSKKFECIKLFNPYKSRKGVKADLKNLYDPNKPFPRINQRQKHIRLLCNKLKHFLEEEEIEIKERKILASAGNMFAGNTTSVAGYFERYKYSIEINGNKEDLQSLMEILLQQWQKFHN